MTPTRAQAYLLECAPGATKLAEVYDDDPALVTALSTLFPGYEYPDISHLTLQDLVRRYKRSKAPKRSTGN